VAYVVAVAGHRPTPEELTEHCRGKLAGFKRPRQVIMLDQLPKTATGKIQRAALRSR
jgi:benzoate-CoA ligase